MARVELLVGLIASGKSTYARERAKDGWIIVNDDSVVEAVHGGDYTLYRESLKPLYKSVETDIFCTALAMGRSVLVDRGVNIRAASRVRWIGLASSMDTPIIAVSFPISKPEDHATRRMLSDPRGRNYDYWYNVARCQLRDWEQPQLKEGFDNLVQRLEQSL